MNRTELIRVAENLHIRADAYSLEGGLPPEQYVLSLELGGWSVYYSERGRRVGQVSFETEDEACDYLMMKLVDDPTTRKRDVEQDERCGYDS